MDTDKKVMHCLQEGWATLLLIYMFLILLFFFGFVLFCFVFSWTSWRQDSPKVWPSIRNNLNRILTNDKAHIISDIPYSYYSYATLCKTSYRVHEGILMLLYCMTNLLSIFMNQPRWSLSTQTYFRSYRCLKEAANCSVRRTCPCVSTAKLCGTFLKVDFTQSCIHIRIAYKIMHFVPGFVGDGFIPFGQSRLPILARKVAFKVHIVKGHY